MPNSTGPMLGPSIDELTSAYRRGDLSPTQVVEDLLAEIGRRGADGTWIRVAERDELLARAAELEAHPSPGSLPLFGVPFAVKDSIDVAGVPTTVACPEYAYVARQTAPAVARLLDAGAVYVGKTNLDQFATGLTGTRTPYPIPRSVYGADLVSGGSSSGSARAVATGQVPFALATDTAGSGRVPPALNGITGFKPTRGLVSTVGLVPACRSLDCISVVAGRVADLARVLDVIAAVDRRDPDSRPRRRSERSGDPRVGLPDPADLEFFGDLPMRDAHLAARAEVGHRFATTTVALTPFLDAGALLYEGPWVAERVAEFGDFSAAHPEAVHPVVRSILDGGRRYTATDVFSAQHRLGQLRAQVAAAWDGMDVLVLPAVGTTFTVAEVLADPMRTNTALGHYTHFGNLLDLCAAVVPAGVTSDGRPVALMVLGPAFSDDLVLAVAAALTEPVQPAQPVGLGVAGAVPVTPDRRSPEPEDEDAGTTTLVVVGHHLTGQPRSADLLRLGGVPAEATCTAPEYRLLKVGQAHPVPALLRVGSGGRGIEVETWTLPAAALADVLTTAAPAVCLGRVVLADGRSEIGFVADATVTAASDVTDITGFGGWRAFLAAAAPPEPALTTDAMDAMDAMDVVDAVPGPYPLPAGRVALVVIDMQRDFLLPGGFGETLGNDVGLLQQVVPPLKQVLASARDAGMLVVHTREGHLPDLSDCPPSKLRRGRPAQRIGDLGPHGRILVRGEYGHDIVDELAPVAGEVVIDKPGKGAFYATDLDTVLHDAGITHLVVTGVTTEVCVHTTVREANDRGYEVLVLSDCVGSYFPEFQRVGVEMVAAQGGIFGWVADSRAWLTAVGRLVPAG